MEFVGSEGTEQQKQLMAKSKSRWQVGMLQKDLGCPEGATVGFSKY